MKPISEMSAAEASAIRYVLMDIDDTLTTAGKLPAVSYAALWRLHEAGLKVIPVTGRPAGWCDLIAREWPVDGVVGENGALVFWEEPSAEPATKPTEGQTTKPADKKPVLKQEFHPDAIRNDHPVLVRVKEKALAGVPGLRLAKDQFARMFDIALDFAEEEPVLPLEAAEKVRAIAAGEGAMAKISSIHVNVWMGAYDKLSMAERFLQKRFGWKGRGDPGLPRGEPGTFPEISSALFQVLFAGDSPNDEPMFAHFPLACGVANVNRYRSCIKTLPAYVSSREGGEGFAEIVGTVLRKR
ncbi:MAG: HAD hydrolase family protein [Treponema sp.]|jgi:hydroxymethylpyrimidine pyrophosphatase-like HAD family hydrolase|nr:HAD hydrolase family protein [Treponema sp.]